MTVAVVRPDVERLGVKLTSVKGLPRAKVSDPGPHFERTLAVGDIIIVIGSEYVTGAAHAASLLKDATPGSTLTIEIERDHDQVMQAHITSLEWLKGPGECAAGDAWAATRPFLVFTSAGDNSAVRRWLSGSPERDWDLCVAYYGDEPDPPCLHGADHGVRSKGGKFGNLLKCCRQQLAYFRRFEAILVLDDDVVMDAGGISTLFAARRRLDLWLLQPAYDPLEGKCDAYPDLRAQPYAHRLVNFVEVTCPLFLTEKLLSFLEVYQPRVGEPLLAGYGIDSWFCQHLLGVKRDGSAAVQDKCAVIDAVSCLNPEDHVKQGGLREIDKLQSKGLRIREWQSIVDRRDLSEWYPFRVFSSVEPPAGSRVDPRVLKKMERERLEMAQAIRMTMP
jgi:hypothetical protein